MKVLLDIKDSKAPFLLEILKNLPFVKSTIISDGSNLILSDISEAVDELNLIKKGQSKSRNAMDFINEL